MPLFRFVLFACGFIVCGFLASDYLLGPTTPDRSIATVVASPAQSSLADWRGAEARKSGRTSETAIVLPTVPQIGPTAERLAFERQLAGNTVPAPVLAQAEPGPVTNARAEMTEATPQRPSAPQRVATIKPKRKQAPRPEIAVVERAPAQREFGGFGGFFGNVF